MVGNDVGDSLSSKVCFLFFRDTGGRVGKEADPGGSVGGGATADAGGSVGKGADPGGRDTVVGLYVGKPLPDVAMGGFENGVGAPVLDAVPGGSVGEVPSSGSSVARSSKKKVSSACRKK